MLDLDSSLLDRRRKGTCDEHLRRPENPTLKRYDPVGSIPSTKWMEAIRSRATSSFSPSIQLQRSKSNFVCILVQF